MADEERPLANEKIDKNVDLFSAIPKFLVTLKQTERLTSTPSWKPVPMSDPSKFVFMPEKKGVHISLFSVFFSFLDFVEKFVEVVFENREGYLDQDGFLEGNWHDSTAHDHVLNTSCLLKNSWEKQ